MYARLSILLLAILLVFTSCQNRKAASFAHDARDYTEKNCPMMMDQVTRLDSIVFVEQDNRIGDMVMYYSLILNDETRTVLMDNLGELADMNLKDLRNSVPLVKYKEAGVGFTYIYRDAETGEKIVEYHFTEKDYQ